MKKHKYSIEDITLSIIYAFYLNYHKKNTNIQLFLFSTATRYEQHKHTVHYVFTVKFTKVNWGQTSFYKESNLNWTMEYIFFLGVLICRFITIFFLIVTLAHQHVGGTCWTCFTPWSLFFRNIAQFSCCKKSVRKRGIGLQSS